MSGSRTSRKKPVHTGFSFVIALGNQTNADTVTKEIGKRELTLIFRL